MKRETEELLNRLFESPVRRAPEAPPPGLSKEFPLCDMPDTEKVLTANIVLLWSTMAAFACDIVKKLAELADLPKTAETAEKRKLFLLMLTELLDTMKLLDPIVCAVGKFGLKHALLNLQLDRAEDAIENLEFAEEMKAVLAEV
jgi:hypothetical protein